MQLASLALLLKKLFKFLTTKDPKSKEPFVNKIRAYNQVLAFSSIGTNLDKDLADAREENYTSGPGGIILLSGIVELSS